MSIPESLLEVREYQGVGYQPVIDYGEWRVAILRWHDDMIPANIYQFQRHHETDEVFVLLSGKCILFIGEGSDTITEIYAEDMEPLKLYNVKRSVWHFHTVSSDAVILIIENRNTGAANSANLALTEAQTAKLIELTRLLWNTDNNPATTQAAQLK
jgi:hypothetical protein